MDERWAGDAQPAPSGSLWDFMGPPNPASQQPPLLFEQQQQPGPGLEAGLGPQQIVEVP